jgi:tRNA-dihydrouridine synthase
MDRGYTEVNLNTGCPSGTVVSKGKGSGMLRDPEQLDGFLDAVFRACPIKISVKTRLGLDDPEEFPALLDVFNRYPIKELTVHPRVRKDFYKEPIRPEWFAYALENSKNPLCYNGDITALANIDDLQTQFPGLEAVMLGRGLVADPGMLSGSTEKGALQAFMAELLERYLEAFGGSRNAMFRLKENWHMLIGRFEGSEKLWKRLRKTTDLEEYKAITGEIFATLPLKQNNCK